MLYGTAALTLLMLTGLCTGALTSTAPALRQSHPPAAPPQGLQVRGQAPPQARRQQPRSTHAAPAHLSGPCISIMQQNTTAKAASRVHSCK